MTVTYTGTLPGDDGSTATVTIQVTPAAVVDPPPAPDPQPQGRCLIGAAGDGVPDGRFAQQLASGRVDIAGTWTDQPVGAQLAVATIKPGAEYGSWTKPLDLAVGAIQLGETWAQAAAGAYDARWRKVCETIRSHWGIRDPGLLRIRWGHEMQGTWYPWSVRREADAPLWREAWSRWSWIQREILPGSLRVMCYNSDPQTGWNSAEALWVTGPERPDVCGIDHYDQYPPVKSRDDWAKQIVATKPGGPRGIEAWRWFAEAKGVPLALCEWGDSADAGPDDPLFVELMRAWLDQHGGEGAGQVAWAVYFNAAYGSGQFHLYPGTRMPKAWGRYRELY